MPIYEFKCNSCRKVASIFFRSFSTPVHPQCPSCQSEDMEKLISRPVILKGQLQRLEEFDLGRSLGKLENPYDAGAAARWAEEMGRELGDEMGADLRDMAQQVEGDERPPELYDPGYFVQSRLERRRQELSGESESGDSGSTDASSGGMLF